MIWLVLFVTMTRGATVQIEAPFPTAEACEIAKRDFKATGMSSVVISVSRKCEAR